MTENKLKITFKNWKNEILDGRADGVVKVADETVTSAIIRRLQTLPNYADDQPENSFKNQIKTISFTFRPFNSAM